MSTINHKNDVLALLLVHRSAVKADRKWRCKQIYSDLFISFYFRKFSGNKNFLKFSWNLRKDWNEFLEISWNFSGGNFRTHNYNADDNNIGADWLTDDVNAEDEDANDDATATAEDNKADNNNQHRLTGIRTACMKLTAWGSVVSVGISGLLSGNRGDLRTLLKLVSDSSRPFDYQMQNN